MGDTVSVFGWPCAPGFGGLLASLAPLRFKKGRGRTAGRIKDRRGAHWPPPCATADARTAIASDPAPPLRAADHRFTAWAANEPEILCKTEFSTLNLQLSHSLQG